jgi:hypothetical protein
MKKTYIQLASEKIWQGNGDPSSLYWGGEIFSIQGGGYSRDEGVKNTCLDGWFHVKDEGSSRVIGLSNIEKYALLDGIVLTDSPLTLEQQIKRFNSFKQAIKPKLLCGFWQINSESICVYLNTGEFAVNAKKRFFALKTINKIQPILAAEVILTSTKPQKREIAMVIRSLKGRLVNRNINLHFHNLPSKNRHVEGILKKLEAR